MAFGLGVLRLTSQQFWALSLLEAVAAWRGLYGEAVAPFSRAALEALMQSFPDKDTDHDGR